MDDQYALGLEDLADLTHATLKGRVFVHPIPAARTRDVDREIQIDAARPRRHDDHPVSELAADRTGALSPFGDLTFPLPADEIPYTHPVTVVNR